MSITGFGALAPLGLKNRIRDPSGDADVGNCADVLVVNRSTGPVPSAACANRFGTPPTRVEAQTIFFPSGVHTGETSKPGSMFNGVSVSRVSSHTQVSDVPSRMSTATRVPSGDNRVVPYDRTGALVGVSIPRRSTHTSERGVDAWVALLAGT